MAVVGEQDRLDRAAHRRQGLEAVGGAGVVEGEEQVVADEGGGLGAGGESMPATTASRPPALTVSPTSTAPAVKRPA